MDALQVWLGLTIGLVTYEAMTWRRWWDVVARAVFQGVAITAYVWISHEAPRGELLPLALGGIAVGALGGAIYLWDCLRREKPRSLT